MRFALVGLALCSCLPEQSPVGAAMKEWSCPKDQMRNVQLPDAYPPVAQPAADVAANTERLSIWKKDHPRGDPDHVYLAGGCGKVGYVSCDYGAHYEDSRGRQENGWFCSVYDLANVDAMEEMALRLDSTGNGNVANAIRAQKTNFFPH